MLEEATGPIPGAGSSSRGASNIRAIEYAALALSFSLCISSLLTGLAALGASSGRVRCTPGLVLWASLAWLLVRVDFLLWIGAVAVSFLQPLRSPSFLAVVSMLVGSAFSRLVSLQVLYSYYHQTSLQLQGRLFAPPVVFNPALYHNEELMWAPLFDYRDVVRWKARLRRSVRRFLNRFKRVDPALRANEGPQQFLHRLREEEDAAALQQGHPGAPVVGPVITPQLLSRMLEEQRKMEERMAGDSATATPTTPSPFLDPATRARVVSTGADVGLGLDTTPGTVRTSGGSRSSGGASAVTRSGGRSTGGSTAGTGSGRGPGELSPDLGLEPQRGPGSAPVAAAVAVNPSPSSTSPGSGV